MSELITRKDAKAQGLLRYFTGIPCSNGHIAERYVRNCVCLTCDVSPKNSRRRIDHIAKLRMNKRVAKALERAVEDVRLGSTEEDRLLWRPRNSPQTVYKDLFQTMGWM